MSLLANIYALSIEFKKRIEQDQPIPILSQEYLYKLSNLLSSDINQEGKIEMFIKIISVNALLREALVDSNLLYIEGLIRYAHEHDILIHVINLGLLEDGQELEDEVMVKYDEYIIPDGKKYVDIIDIAELSMYLVNSLKDNNQERIDLLYQDMFLKEGVLYSKRITLMQRACNILNSFQEVSLAKEGLLSKGNSLLFRELQLPFREGNRNTLEIFWSIQMANKFGILLELIKSIKQEG
jgi:hypothetical protein